MDPIQFINNLGSNQHILQVMTDANKGKAVQFHFIDVGLQKGEPCTYMTHEDPKKTKNQMQSSGIDVDRFTAEHLLSIYRVPDLLRDKDGPVEAVKKMIAEINADLPQKRIVGRPINDVSTEYGMAAQLEIEKYTHSVFNKLDTGILCH